MLKPGGQLFFHAFEKTTVDDAYDTLDRGKWIKYSNGNAISPFYRCENVINQYENVIKSVGFEDCKMFQEIFTLRSAERIFEGEVIKNNIVPQKKMCQVRLDHHAYMFSGSLNMNSGSISPNQVPESEFGICLI